MSIKLMDMVADRFFKNATDKNVLMAIANHASDCGHGAWASHQAIADRAGVSRETAGRSIKRLLASKLIRKDGKRVRGSAWTHEYRVDLHALSDMPLTQTAQAAKDRLENREVTERHNDIGREVTFTQEGSDADTPREVTERHND
ncbi:MAG: helix-turn-helix domain-containing protein, partial [Pseudomonadota bacterium]